MVSVHQVALLYFIGGITCRKAVITFYCVIYILPHYNIPTHICNSFFLALVIFLPTATFSNDCLPVSVANSQINST